MTWNTHLTPYQQPDPPLFAETFLQQWGAQAWAPSNLDRKAAGRLHGEIISRISTQRLGYLDGVELAALNSLYTLFEKTRKIVDDAPCAHHFELIAWEVLNGQVRPFTAKWHRESERGRLSALDTTDEFRSELSVLQPILARFADLLAYLRDGNRPPAALSPKATPREQSIAQELVQAVPFGIRVRGDFDPTVAGLINQAEKQAIEDRRRYYGITPDRTEAIALALSGGGIRSATFSLGVLVALTKKNLLKDFDYLSTVSGGGYFGSFLTSFLASRPTVEPPNRTIGLRREDVPFRKDEGEAEALRHIRHHSKYLATGSILNRLSMVFAQLYGLLLNGANLGFIISVCALVEYGLRTLDPHNQGWRIATLYVGAALAVVALIAPLSLRGKAALQRWTDTTLAVLATGLIGLLVWGALGQFHLWLERYHDWNAVRWIAGKKEWWLSALGSLPVIASAFTAYFGATFRRTGTLLVTIAAVAAPLFLFGAYLGVYHFLTLSTDVTWITFAKVTPIEVLAGFCALLGLLALFQNINFTSPHRHYRNKLAEAYLIKAKSDATGQRLELEPSELRLSDVLGKTQTRGPYHLINAALNVPASHDAKMQGRRTDFFLFSPAYCGSPLTGYEATAEWEKADPHLDLGTAMAISGAAASPHMGLGTIRGLTFWMVLFNIRLGYWLPRPGGSGPAIFRTPGLRYLLNEMLGLIDEKSPWLNLSDGGHIENLGVYELLRRRCKYIVSVDGEQDSRMTFAALTTLQRLAQIDLGVRIDAHLDDLRLNDKGYSRSHFRFCRITYPEGNYGYLLYVKLSLTGNEGEFLRRYRLDEPAFPHHSTADQFFTEAQFEAYRSLGEHIGDKLFLPALVGPVAAQTEVDVPTWFRELAKNLLEPVSPSATLAGPAASASRST